MQKRARKAGGLLFLTAGMLAVVPLRAHDLWLEPAAPLAARGDELLLHLEFGDAFTSTEERPLQKDHVTRFDLLSDRARRRDLLAIGQDDQVPAAKLKLESGEALAVMDRVARTIVMPPDKFERYLTDEGFDTIAAQRTRLNQADQPARETYTRYLKALVQERDLTATTPSTLYKRRVGQRLEILLETDPGRMKPDGDLTVKVLFEGKPLAGTRVSAYRRAPNTQASPPAALTATTSARGLAEFKVDQPGSWLVRLVYMRPSTDKRPDGPQWESFWAAYTFAVRILPPTTQTPTPTPKDG